MLKESPVHITPKALDMIKSIMESKEVPDDYSLRVGRNNSASCGATSYVLGFDTRKSTDDSYLIEGVEVLINKKEMLFLIDLTLDYEDGEETSGFRFDKPTR